MKIERIIKKNAQDVLIQFINSSTLILSLEVFLKSGLKKSDEISEDRFLSFILENKKYHIKQRAFRLLGRRQHSILELKQKLLQKDYEPKLVLDVLLELTSNGYLNDKKFASFFIEEKLRLKNWGKRKLKTELFKKGVDGKIINEVLNENLSEINGYSGAENLAIKKLNSLETRKYDSLTLKQKIYSFLVSRGYDYEVVNKVIKKILGEKFQDD